jgi:gliding motility-associated-like protein
MRVGGVLVMVLIVHGLGVNDATAQQDHFPPIEFLHNQGQWSGEILYKGDIGAGHIFLRSTGFTFMMLSPGDVTKVEEYYHGSMKHPGAGAGNSKRTSLPPVIHGDTYIVDFLHASKAVTLSADHPFPEYYNYFIGNDSTKWAGHVGAFAAVLYHGLYPGIDMHVYSEASQLKYDLIVNPGSDPGIISLAYHGQQGMELRHGQLYIHSGVGDILEMLPYAYQMISGSRVAVPCSYVLKDNTVSFELRHYDPTSPLIIDPLVVFATFTGSRGDNWGYTATYDAQGNFYAGGIIFGQTGNYVTTPGAFQQTFGGGVGVEGGFDMAICKFDPTGRRLIFGTYLGGNNNEQPHSLVVDPQGELIIAGRTNSTNYPALKKAGPGGGWDIVVTKLNAAGSALVGSIEIGGTDDDGVNISENRELGTTSLMRNYGDDARSEVEIDAAGNVYVASCTQSHDFPVTAGAFQQLKGDNSGQYDNSLVLQDGVVLKLKPDLSSLIWSSYLGGSGNDAAYVVELDKTGNLYVAGGTSSIDLPVTPDVIQPTFGGGDCDGFIAEISNDGSTLMRLTYLGTPAADQIYGLQFDDPGNLYVSGVTEGSWPVVNAAFSNPGARQFISKLNPNLKGPFIYSTVYGVSESMPNISPVAFLVDKCQNVYVSGWGGELNTKLGYTQGSSGTTGMPITADAVQNTTDGSDFYFFVLKRDAASQLYGTYYGGNGLLEHVDGGTSRFDKNGIIYEAICGGCGGYSNFPTTPGVWSQANNSQNCNEVALKISFNLSGVKAGIRSLSRDTSGCTPLQLQFTDTIAQGKQYRWDYGDGSPDYVSTLPQSADHTYSATGTYRVRLVSIDSATCNVSDTSYMNVSARSDEATIGFEAQKLPPCTNLSYQFSNISTPPAGKPFRESFFWNFGDGSPLVMDDTSRITHGYTMPGNYQVTLTLRDTAYCNSPDSTGDAVRLSPQVQALIATPSSGCIPYTAVFTNNSRGGLSFQWDFGDGSPGSNQVNPSHQYNTPGKYIVTLIASDSSSCNLTDTTRDTITVHSPPVAGFGYSPAEAEANTPTQFTNTSTGAQNWLWNFGDGSSDTLYSPSHIFPKTGNFKVCLNALDGLGCADSSCATVSAVIIPKFDIPSAFSPNGDGINDVFKIEGFGIAGMDMRIFNRWGQLVFEGRNLSQGWDGRFKGIIQPMDVYAYTITVEFTDGTHATRTGSITLIR